MKNNHNTFLKEIQIFSSSNSFDSILNGYLNSVRKSYPYLSGTFTNNCFFLNFNQIIQFNRLSIVFFY